MRSTARIFIKIFISLIMKNFVVATCLILLIIGCSKPTRFERLPSAETGIDFINALEEKDSFNILHNEYMYNGGGVGVGDLNNDGLQDLVFTGNMVSSRIYLNEGHFKFRDITAAFDGINNGQWISGVTMIDINNDGWLDVYFTCTTDKNPEKRRNQLWLNNGINQKGELTFTETAKEFGIDDDGYSVHAAFLDYDLDGDLDLYVLNNIVNKAVPTNYRPKIADGSSVNNDRFYRNEGNGTFTDVTKEAGILYEGYGLGIAVGDVNKDGYPDLYISNDYISNDVLYINQKDGTFKNETKQYISYQSRFSMGNDMADVNNDGNLDIITVDMMPEEYSRKKQTINGNSYLVYINNEKYGYEPQFVRNMLHFHNGFLNGEMLPFSEVGQIMGVFETEWSWSPLFADYDNDGDKDLMMTNGFPKDLTDKDFTNYKAQVYGFVASDKHILGKIPIVKVSNYAFENNGEAGFRDRTEEWGMKIPSFSNGAAFADLDNDGDLDYVVNNIDEEAYVYRNNSIGKLKENRNYVKIKLVGKDQNLQAIGTKVELWTNGAYQYHEHFLTRGYISSVDPIVHFGLGENAGVDSVRIVWPDQRVTVLKSVPINQLVEVKQSEENSFPFSGQKMYMPHMFESTSQVLQFAHEEDDFVDFFQNQRILQHKLSQIGPCMAKGDLDGDGIDDLIIGGSVKNPTSVFLYKNGRFIQTHLEGLTTSKSCEESDLFIVDIDNDGDNDVIAVAGGASVENIESYQHAVYVNDAGSFKKMILPVPSFSASVVRPADFDNDGDIDLFIGARVSKGNFPDAPASFVLVNENGTFVKKDNLIFPIGMITDAVWSDYNKDGFRDIILSREWRSIAILRNNGGKDFELVDDKTLEAIHGLWYTVAAADLDNDGDDDFVVGNLGDNHRFTINEKFPLRLYAVDIDNNGSIDPITTSYWKDGKGKMQEYPVNYLDELASQSPFFRKKFTSYTKFSYTTADSILGGTPITKDQILHVNSTSSYILWNRGSAGFEWEKLPATVQTSPVRKILLRDLNGDGNMDIVIAGNDYTYDVSTGYIDAGKGLVLLGKGNGEFEVLPPSRTGLLLKGQISSLQYFDGPAPMLVAGVNRDSVRVFHHVK
jgi:enediyne biosynthesis protein E4